MRWLPVLLIVLSNVAYHVGQKSVPKEANPFVASLAMYGVASLGAVLVLLFLPATKASAGAALHWSVALVGLAILGIEVGFLLTYRAGWEISTASLVAAVLLAAALVPIGVLFFREPISAQRALGLLLAGAGLWLLKG